MARLSAKYPDDRRGRGLLRAGARRRPPIRRTRPTRDLLKAGAILEKLWQRSRIIRASRTTSSTATTCRRWRRAPSTAARRYAKIAPAAPHALHMPSHTFTRLGYWQDSIDTNILSAEAARKAGAIVEELHATRLPGLRLSAERPGRRRAAARRARGGVGRATRTPNARAGAAPPPAGMYALAAIPGPLRARARRLGRGGAPRTAAEPGRLRRRVDVVRPRARRRADRAMSPRPGPPSPSCRRPSIALTQAEGNLLGRAGDDSEARRVGVAGAAEGKTGRRARRDARGRGPRRPHGKGGRHAGPAGAGA